MVLEFGGFFGVGIDCYLLLWNMFKYDIVKDGYVVNFDKK